MSTGSRDFDASSDLLDSGTWGFTSDAVTIAGWVYLDSIPAGRDVRFVSKASGTAATAHDWMLGYAESGGTAQLRARTHNNANSLVQAGTLATGQWVHVAVRADYNGGVSPARRLYINGVGNNNDGNAAAQITSNSNAVYIGNQPTSATAAPDGRLCDFAVWSVLLSEADIADLAALTTRPSDYPTGLQAYYSGGDITDSSGNSRDATNSGTTLSSSDPGFNEGSVCAESISLTAAQSETSSRNSARAESVSLTDSQTEQSTLPRTTAESVTLTAAQSETGSVTSSSADSVTLTAAQSEAASLNSSRQESINLAAEQSEFSAVNSVRAESIGLAETQSSNVFTARFVNSLLIGERRESVFQAFALDPGVFSAQCTESLGLAEAQAEAAGLNSARQESIGLAASQNGSLNSIFSKQRDESIGLADAAAEASSLGAARAEGLSLSAAQSEASALSSARAESLGFAAAQSEAASTNAAAAESIGLAEVQSGSLNSIFAKQVAESLGLADASSKTVASGSVRAESIGFADACSESAAGLHAQIDEALGLAAAQQGAAAFQRFIGEVLTFAGSQDLVGTPVPEHVFKIVTTSRIHALKTVTRINEKARA